VLADDRAAMHAEALEVSITPGEGEGHDTDVEGRINEGSLTATQEAAGIALSDVTLDGTPQTSRGDLNTVTVRDTRGSTLGWELTGAVTDFRSDTGATIPAAGFAWTPTCATLGPGVTQHPRRRIGGPRRKPAPLLCRQTGGTAGPHRGAFSADAALTLAMPAYVRAGHYSADLVLSLS